MRKLPLNYRSIHAKLFFIILLFVCAPLLVLGYIWYEKSTATIEHNAVQYSQYLLKQTNEYMDFYLNDLEKATLPFLTKPEVQSFLSLNPASSTRYEKYVLSSKIQNEAFGDILEGRSDIYGISLINKNEMQVNNYVHVGDFLNMEQIKDRNLQMWKNEDQLDTYQIMNLTFIHSTPVLTIVRKVYDKNTYETSGLLIVNLRLNQIENIINEVTLSHFKNVWIVDQNNKIIYHPNENELGQTFSYQDSRQGTDDQFFINRNSAANTLQVYDHSPVSNWTMIANVPMKSIMGELISLRNSTMWIGLILIGVALLFVGGFSLSLTYSLTHLQKLMKKAQHGNLIFTKTKPLPFYRHDEISELYESFYSMTNDLNRLIAAVHYSKRKENELELKNRESELQAMQSQINPHFLYNTLEIINSYAIIENQMMISRMTTSLADMFRYNVSNTKTIVTLEEELQHIKAYMEIQKERFEDLTVVYDVNEQAVKAVLAARITLQPIIENAFIHGYEDHELKPDFIGIYGIKEPARYIVYIVDRGKGMSGKTMDMFNQSFEQNQDPPLTNKTTKRIGLINVHKRISSNFGDRYGLFIKQSDERGTVIQINLPFDYEVKKKEA